ncbi:hypothetical protein B296_00051595 [Ensete ventricosum]|uniref:Uncharacterized protein n=1 Tax=Ensete ventricosum TaxID=4639 RepID=A0A426WY33_ENSVE|nr:hypothetical protein B296_00051595 [Ensete ventricosum]
MHRVDAVGNSLVVCWELAEGIRSLLGWHKGVRQKKIETRRKIVGGAKACRDSLGDSSKGSGSSLGTRREIAGRRPDDSPQEYRRLSDWRQGNHFCENSDGKPPVSDRFTVVAKAPEPPKADG